MVFLASASMAVAVVFAFVSSSIAGHPTILPMSVRAVGANMLIMLLTGNRAISHTRAFCQLLEGTESDHPLAGPVLRAMLMQLPFDLLAATAVLYISLPQAILLWTEPDMETGL